MPGEPRPHVRGLVGADVVEHHVDLAPGVGAGQQPQEGEEVVARVPLAGLLRHLPRRDLERREQAQGAVALVVAWVWRSTWPGFIGNIGAVRSRAWIWVFSSTLNTIARSGGAR